MPRKKRDWRERATPEKMKFGGKTYGFTDLYSRKFQADDWAKRYRKLCMNARVVKTHDGRYAIFTRRRKGCKK